MQRLVSLLLFFAIAQANAQPYIPMLGETNEWRVVSCFNGCVTSAYFTSGETTVDGQTYRVLDGYHYINGNMLIREDVQERKVYLKQTFGHSLLPEFTLYDFSLEDGDTVDVYNPLSPLPEDGGQFVLDSIVLKPLQTTEHRHFYLHAVDPQASQSEGTIWIEGVGALSLINSPGEGPTEAEHLVCALKNDELMYTDLDSIYSCGSLSLEEQPSAPELQVYPNPASGFVQLSFTENVQPLSMQLTSVDGRTVLVEPWQAQLDISGLPSGIYLLQCVLESGKVLGQRIAVTE